MNSFGRLFRISIFGESHGEMVGVTLDGIPAGIPLNEESFAADLARRKSGKCGTTPRKESDAPHLVSGVFNGFTTGAPLTVVFYNENTLSGDYRNLVTHPALHMRTGSPCRSTKGLQIIAEVDTFRDA